MHIILASSSPYRKIQLEHFGVAFTAIRPLVDEDALKLEGPRDPVELTKFLAKAKAESLAKDHPHALIIGSDQMADLEGERLDKPGSIEGAEAQLRKLSGREHWLITAVACVFDGRAVMDTELTRVRMRELTDDTIKAYVALDQPLDCAGSYKIERAGLALVEEINGADPGAIQGLPLIALRRALDTLNVSLTDLWRSTHAHP